MRIGRHYLPFLLAATAAFAAGAASAPAPAATENFHWQGNIASGDTLTVQGVNGEIEATLAPGSELVIDAEKSGTRDNPSEIKIVVLPHQGGITVCALYPSKDGPQNECKPRGEGRMNVRNNDVSVHFRIKVPKGVHLLAKTVNGNVRASSLGGDVEARTVNGSVNVTTTGSAKVKTVNGSIDASLGTVKGASPMEFETVNGPITVKVPTSASARVKARTVNGRISSEFPVQIKGWPIPSTMDGVIGNGETPLTISTVNGAIRLEKTEI